MRLVYCHRCGAENEDDALSCRSCGAPLRGVVGAGVGRRREDELCFGAERGLSWFGVFIGALIILAGLSWLLGHALWDWLAPAAAIVFGLFIVYRALSGRGWGR